MKTATKERPVLFSGEMVRAILDGRKSQTRRIIKPQPKPCDHSHWSKSVSTDFQDQGTMALADEPSGEWCCRICGNGCNSIGDGFRCPYGKPGDRLTISEAITVTAVSDEAYKVHFHADHSIVERFGTPELIAKIRAYKRPYLRGVSLPSDYARADRLEIKEVRVERLQEITEADVEAEGIWSAVEADDSIIEMSCRLSPRSFVIARDYYRVLWNRINGPGSWEANPWVWVVEFERIAQ